MEQIMHICFYLTFTREHISEANFHWKLPKTQAWTNQNLALQLYRIYFVYKFGIFQLFKKLIISWFLKWNTKYFNWSSKFLIMEI